MQPACGSASAAARDKRSAAVALCLIADGPVGAAEEPKSPPSRGRGHRGDKDIVTGEFRFTAEVTEKPPAPKTYGGESSRRERILRNRLSSITNTQTRRSYEKAIETADQNVPPQLIRNAAREITILHGARGIVLGRRSLCRISCDRQADQPSGSSRVSLAKIAWAWSRSESVCRRKQRPDGRRFRSSVGWNSGSATAWAIDGVTGGPWRRLHRRKGQGRASPQIRGGGESSRGDWNIHKIGRYFSLDRRPSRGVHSSPDQERNSAGTILRDWTCANYNQPHGSKLWFPRSVLITSSRTMRRCRSRSDTPLLKMASVLNNTIPSSRFQLTIPKGRTVIDNRGKTQQLYSVAKTLEMSLDDLDSIGATKGLVRSTRALWEDGRRFRCGAQPDCGGLLRQTWSLWFV